MKESNHRNYQLIALDMDGTLLNSEKKITPAVKAMINLAFDQGKEVVLSTGRCLPELYDTFAQLPRLRYAICVSGSCIYDIHEKKSIVNYQLSPEICREILKEGKKEDIMLHFLCEDSIVQKDKIRCMDRYHMGVYQTFFEKICVTPEDMFAFYEENPIPLNKLNFYHAEIAARDRSLKRLQHLPIELVFAEGSSVECSPKGVTKGKGLLDLCHHLGISVEETIAVGDADNDLAILRTAGLAVAMGNANENVKAVCHVEVADCDHDGVAEAIERYLL